MTITFSLFHFIIFMYREGEYKLVTLEVQGHFAAVVLWISGTELGVSGLAATAFVS